MKKIIKNNLRVFVSIIISAVIFTSIGVYAASYLAKDISYNKNGQVTVADALDDLYSKKEDNNYDNKTYTQEGLETVYDRVSIVSGGYYVDSKNVTWVNLKLKVLTNLSGDGFWTLIYGLPSVSQSFIVTDTTKTYAFKIGNNYDKSRTDTITFYDHMNTSISKDTEFTLQFKY